MSKKLKVEKLYWIKKANIWFATMPFGVYSIRENSKGKFDVYFNQLLELSDLENTVVAKKTIYKVYKYKVRECCR